MVQTIDIYLVDAFTKTKNKGNRAGVVFNAQGLTEEQMQEIAAFANVSETAFIIESNSDDSHEVHVRYFTPTTEVPICGHATIAAHYLRAMKNDLKDVQVLSKTGAGILPVDIKADGEDIKVVMTQGSPSMENILSSDQRKKLMEALDLEEEDLIENLPIQIVSTGHSKVMIPIKSQETLNQLSPNMDVLDALSHEIDSYGYYVFTIEDENQPYRTHGRMFAPAIGITEDPVTGNANGPAGLYMAAQGILDFDANFSYRAIQGEAMGKSGVVEVLLEKENNEVSKVMVSGSAIEAETLTYSL